MVLEAGKSKTEGLATGKNPLVSPWWKSKDGGRQKEVAKPVLFIF
jgi:hypothetical protein